MAARSYDVSITNNTGEKLTRTSASLDHGIWSQDGTRTPPDTIPPGETIKFGNESEGFLTGAEGHVKYTSSAGDFTVYWENRQVAPNASRVSCPDGIHRSVQDTKGNNAFLTVVFGS
jgi:hypothetical protein